MGNFRFHRRVKIFPGLAVNLSKSGPSFTFGVRGAHVTVGHGRVTRTVGIPGSGLYYTSSKGTHSGVHSAHVDAPVSPRTQQVAHWTIGGVVIGALAAFGGGVLVLLALAALAVASR